MSLEQQTNKLRPLWGWLIIAAGLALFVQSLWPGSTFWDPQGWIFLMISLCMLDSGASSLIKQRQMTVGVSSGPADRGLSYLRGTALTVYCVAELIQFSHRSGHFLTWHSGPFSFWVPMCFVFGGGIGLWMIFNTWRQSQPLRKDREAATWKDGPSGRQE